MGRDLLIRRMGLMYRFFRFDVDIHHLAVEVHADGTGPDVLHFGRLKSTINVCGVFAVVDGRIRLRRDYFSSKEVGSGVVVDGAQRIGRRMKLWLSSRRT